MNGGWQLVTNLMLYIIMQLGLLFLFPCISISFKRNGYTSLNKNQMVPLIGTKLGSLLKGLTKRMVLTIQRHLAQLLNQLWFVSFWQLLFILTSRFGKWMSQMPFLHGFLENKVYIATIGVYRFHSS